MSENLLKYYSLIRIQLGKNRRVGSRRAYDVLSVAEGRGDERLVGSVPRIPEPVRYFSEMLRTAAKFLAIST